MSTAVDDEEYAEFLKWNEERKRKQSQEPVGDDDGRSTNTTPKKAARGLDEEELDNAAKTIFLFFKEHLEIFYFPLQYEQLSASECLVLMKKVLSSLKVVTEKDYHTVFMKARAKLQQYTSNHLAGKRKDVVKKMHTVLLNKINRNDKEDIWRLNTFMANNTILHRLQPTDGEDWYDDICVALFKKHKRYTSFEQHALIEAMILFALGDVKEVSYKVYMTCRTNIKGILDTKGKDRNFNNATVAQVLLSSNSYLHNPFHRSIAFNANTISQLDKLPEQVRKVLPIICPEPGMDQIIAHQVDEENNGDD